MAQDWNVVAPVDEGEYNGMGSGRCGRGEEFSLPPANAFGAQFVVCNILKKKKKKKKDVIW